MKPLLGIDLGTTTARAAVVSGDDVKMVPHGDEALAIPSLVTFPSAGAGGGRPLEGFAAMAGQVRYPERTVGGIKRLLGRRFDSPEVRHHRQAVAYDLVAARNGDVRVRVGRRHHAPQDIAAYLMGALRTAAERLVGEAVTEAVLAVPALFNDLQRQAVRDAARIAGLQVLGVITATSAALLGSGAYPAGRGEERRTLVYDLGGGSFEVSAVLVGDRTAEVEASGGDAFLGGDDFDQRIVAYVCDEVLKASGGDLRRDRALLARLSQVAERVKVELSSASGVDIHVPVTPGRAPQTVHLDRRRLELLTQDLVDRTVWSCESVLREAKWSKSDVDMIMMLGGQANMPRIQAQLAEICGKAPVDVVGAELVVAMGAAQHAAVLVRGARGRGRGRVPSPVTERTNISLGLESAGGIFTRLIPRGTPLPATRTQLLATSADNQTQIVLHLLQGEREMASDNESLVRFQIGPLPGRRRGEIRLEVDIATDGSGLPSASARIAESGETKPVRVRPSAGLTEAEIVTLAAAHASGTMGSGTLLSDLGGPDGNSSELASAEPPSRDVSAPDSEPLGNSADAADPLPQGG